MTVIKASRDDIAELQAIYSEAKERMRESGNMNQWTGDYPPISLIESDIDNGFLYLVKENGMARGAFSILTKAEPTYDKIYDGCWPGQTHDYVTIHRVAGRRNAHHILKTAVETAERINSTIRIDTHEDNRKMQALIIKYGFKYCGKIFLADGSMRLAYQKG